MQESNDIINEVTSGDYKYGFVTDIDTELIHRGLDEETVRIISAKKNEPDWLFAVPVEGFPPLADIGDAHMASPKHSTD